MRVTDAVKRGFVIAASNWPLSLLLFCGQLLFQTIIAVPTLLALIGLVTGAGRAWPELRGRDLRDLLTLVTQYFEGHLAGLILFGLVIGAALLCGSIVMFFLKGGAVGTILDAHRGAGSDPAESRWHADSFRRAQAFSRRQFIASARCYFVRYLVLGLALSWLYLLSGGAYLMLLYGTYRAAGGLTAGGAIGWTLLASAASLVFVAWITFINLYYLLTQIAIAANEAGVLAGLAAAAAFLVRQPGRVAGAFGILLLVVLCTTVLFLLSAAVVAGLALVPLVGLLMIPLQLLNFMLRPLVYQFLGMAALGTYVSLYDNGRRKACGEPASAAMPLASATLKQA